LLSDTRPDMEPGLNRVSHTGHTLDACVLKLSDPAAVHIQNAMFAKNLPMLGAALLLSQFGLGPVSIDERRGHGS
jgi:hypothetical protein